MIERGGDKYKTKFESDHNVNQMIKIEITKQVNKAVWEIINCGLKSRGAGMKIR